MKTSSPDHQMLLQSHDLSRWVGERCLLENLNLQVCRGEVLGLLGLNGAGKTTTLNLLAGVLQPSLGDVTVNGHSMLKNPQQAKRSIGYLPETPPLYMDMRVRTYLEFCAKLHGLKGQNLRQAVEQVLQSCQLETVAKRVIRNLSKGYRQRIGIAQAIVHRPEVILLDEPSSGLDPQQMMEMRTLIRELAHDSAIVFSSHLLSEVTDLCDRVCVIHQGSLIHQQSRAEMAMQTGRTESTQTLIIRLKDQINAQTLNQIKGVLSAEPLNGQRWKIEVLKQHVDQLPEALIQEGWRLQELTTDRSSLEQLFTSLVTGAQAGAKTNMQEPEAYPAGSKAKHNNLTAEDDRRNDATAYTIALRPADYDVSEKDAVE